MDSSFNFEAKGSPLRRTFVVKVTTVIIEKTKSNACGLVPLMHDGDEEHYKRDYGAPRPH
jgi:hypothetical protein